MEGFSKLIVFSLFLIATIECHTTLTDLVINGVKSSSCLKPRYPDNLYPSTKMGAAWPIQSSTMFLGGVEGANYTCGFLPYANNPSSTKCTVAAGSTIGASYYHGANTDEDPVLDRFIARTHKGPFIVYMAKQTGNTVPTTGWFKIYQSGKITESSNYNNVKWASAETLLATGGTFNFQIPADITPGNYLLRTEIIALHDTSPSGAQPYVTCAELTVTGGGASNPAGVAIPGTWNRNHPGLTYNIYSQFRDAYPFPGPAVYVATTPVATTGAPPAVATTGQATVTTGIRATTGRVVTTSRAYAVTTSQRPNQVEINVKVTALLAVTPSILDVVAFTDELVAVLRIPYDAVKEINIDFDRSTNSITVVGFVLFNLRKQDGTYVDPVNAARVLRDKADNNDIELQNSQYLNGMKIEGIEYPEEVAGDSNEKQPFEKSLAFIVIVVVAGVVLVAAMVVVAIVVLRRRKH